MTIEKNELKKEEMHFFSFFQVAQTQIIKNKHKTEEEDNNGH